MAELVYAYASGAYESNLVRVQIPPCPPGEQAKNKNMRFPDFKHELESLRHGYTFAAGCDEVGVAPLAGPVVAAACILDQNSIGKYRSKKKWYCRVRDSKTTTEEEREVLHREILRHTLAYGVGEVWQAEIDKLNIHNASLRAMRLAVEKMLRGLARKNLFKSGRMLLFVDGRFTIPDLERTGLQLEQKSVIDADALILSVSAASIIAKVHRDKIMQDLHLKFPAYGFASHKGYPTLRHRNAIKKWGISGAHRKSFVKNK